MKNAFGYTVQSLRRTIPLAIKVEAQPVQFGPEGIAGRVPAEHYREVEDSKRILKQVLARINGGASQDYVDAVAETILRCETCITYVPSSWGYGPEDML